VSRWTRVGAGAGAGLLASLALVTSPLLAGLPAIRAPYVPVDLRWVVLPVAFALSQLAGEAAGWPGAATGTLVAASTAAVAANVHASQVLAYLGVGWARPGMEIDLVAFTLSLAALAVGLWVAFDAARERFGRQLLARGVPEDELAPVTAWARGRAREAVAVAGLAVAGLALAVRLSSQALGGASVPLPSLAAIGLALALGSLFLGLPRRREA
jgi:hypothetical protein